MVKDVFRWGGRLQAFDRKCVKQQMMDLCFDLYIMRLLNLQSDLAIKFITSSRMVTQIAAISFDLSGYRIICECPTFLIATEWNSLSDSFRSSIGGVDCFDVVLGAWNGHSSHCGKS
jgi:hypothetical protein